MDRNGQNGTDPVFFGCSRLLASRRSRETNRVSRSTYSSSTFDFSGFETSRCWTLTSQRKKLSHHNDIHHRESNRIQSKQSAHFKTSKLSWMSFKSSKRKPSRAYAVQKWLVSRQNTQENVLKHHSGLCETTSCAEMSRSSNGSSQNLKNRKYSTSRYS